MSRGPSRRVFGGARSRGVPVIDSPIVPVEATRRGRSHQIQEDDRCEGRFTERFLEFPYPPIPPTPAPGSSVLVKNAVQSMGSRFTRVLGVRVTVLASNLPPVGLEAAWLYLQLQIGAQEDWITTQGLSRVKNSVSFAALNSGSPDPWFWFASPPRLTTGDTLQATVTNNPPADAGIFPTLTVSVTMKVIDDRLYTDLYALDLAAELEVEEDHDQQDEWAP
jgi:hypothetical protein